MNESLAAYGASAEGDGARRTHRASPASTSAQAGARALSSESEDSCSCPHPYSHSAHAAGDGGGGREWRRWGWSARRPHARGPHPPLQHSRQLHHRLTYPPDNLLNGSEWDPLSQDMWDQFLASQQTEETYKKKINLCRFLYLSIKSLFPRYGLYLVGSTMTGFGLDSSDMDLCLYVRPVETVDPRSHALLHLGFILHFMRSCESVLSNADLIQAKVPILKFRDARHGIQVDLNCNNVVGIRNTNLLLYYSHLDWRVRPLVLVVKLWAQANDINDARHCTLSSYSLTLMVLHYLQCGTSPPVLPCLRVSSAAPPHPPPPPPPHPPALNNTHTLAELLLGFLRYYAHFQYDKMAVSVRVGRCVPVSECRAARSLKNDPHQWKFMCVEEPFDLTNTARSVYDPDGFDKILGVFRRSGEALARGLRLWHIMPLSPAPHQHQHHQHQHQHHQRR